MIIKNISIENFQSYYNCQELSFSKGLNLIIGNGGKGKSKLFNAFYWALFGKIYITDNGWIDTNDLAFNQKIGMEKHEFVNKRALFCAKSFGDLVRASVIIELTNVENNKEINYIIERSVIAKRITDGEWDHKDSWAITNSELKVSFDIITGTKVETKEVAKLKIDDLFPSGIRNYIWFQGESLDRLIDFRKKETLKSAVKHISYYPFYEKLSNIIAISTNKIGDLERKRTKEQNKTNITINNLIANLDNNKILLEKAERNRTEIESSITELSIILNDDRNKLSGLAGFTGLINEYNKCKEQLSSVMYELTQLDEYQRKQLPQLWLLRGITPMIEECKDIINSYTAQQDTVPEKKYLENPGRSKLEEILIKHQCYICGSDVIDDSKAYNTIINRIKEQEDYLQELEDYRNNMSFNKKFERFVGSISDYPDNILLFLKNIDKHWAQSEEDIEKYLQKKRILLERKHELDEKMQEFKRKYNVDPQLGAEQANVISNGMKATQSNLEKLNRKLDAEKESIIRYKSEIRSDQKELDKFNNKSGIHIPETEWKNISEFLKDICQNVQEKARKELLQKIERRANEFYERFTQHDNGYKGSITINEDYSIAFDAGLNTSHEDRKKMSIINAMLSLNQEALGVFYPFISDAPTSNFDIETTQSYLLGIKDMFDQSIIMTKDVDINSPQYNCLLQDNNVSHIYLLESELHNTNTFDPLIYEVSSVVKILK